MGTAKRWNRDKRRQSKVDGARSVPNFPRALLRRRDEQRALRFRRDEEIFLRWAGFGQEDEFDLTSLHRLAGLRVEITVSDVSASVDDRMDFRLPLLRAGQDLFRKRRHDLGSWKARRGIKRSPMIVRDRSKDDSHFAQLLDSHGRTVRRQPLSRCIPGADRNHVSQLRHGKAGHGGTRLEAAARAAPHAGRRPGSPPDRREVWDPVRDDGNPAEPVYRGDDGVDHQPRPRRCPVGVLRDHAEEPDERSHRRRCDQHHPDLLRRPARHNRWPHRDPRRDPRGGETVHALVPEDVGWSSGHGVPCSPGGALFPFRSLPFALAFSQSTERSEPEVWSDHVTLRGESGTFASADRGFWGATAPPILPGDSQRRQPGRNPYGHGLRWADETMTSSYETGREAMAELGAKQPHELLLILGGVLAILLSVAIYGVQWANQGIPRAQYGDVASTVIINVVLGGSLWASAAMTRKNLMNGAIVAVVISIILIYYGGQPGTIGGVVGILGAIVAAAKPYLPWSRRSE